MPDKELDKEQTSRYPYVQTSVWGGTPNDPALEGAVNAVLSGVTSTHIADTLYTDNKKSFIKAQKAGIPAKEFVDADGNTAYEIHFSFGPDNIIGSMLDDSYLTNCLNAQLITPVAEEDLKNNQEYKTNKVNSNLDFLKVFTSKIYLYPLFNSKIPKESWGEDIKDFDEEIHDALEKYVKSERNDESRSKYFERVDAALTKLQSSRDPNYGVPGREMTKNQFLYWFNQNIGTIGLEPKTKIETKLISEDQSRNGMKGFVEERYVNEMVRIKNSMDGKRYQGAIGMLLNPIIERLYSYNFVSFNCSNAVGRLHEKSANDERIRGKLHHTIGWNDLNRVRNNIRKHGFFSEKTRFAMAEVVIGVLEFVGLRFVETPTNFARNLIAANKVSEKIQQSAGQKPEPQPAPKMVNDPNPSSRLQKVVPELKSRLSAAAHPHHLTLKMHGQKNGSLQNLVRRAEQSKIRMEVLVDENTNKPSSVVFYSDHNKNMPIATVDLKPNNSNTINIQFDDLPLDQHHKIVTLLNVLKKDVQIDKGSKEPMIFTIGFSDKSVMPDVHNLQRDIQKVFGADASIRMKALEASPVQKNTGLRNQ